MSEEWREYAQDPRTVCKYKGKCYQKNPEHHKTYKHPPVTTKGIGNRFKKRFNPYARDRKQSPDNIDAESQASDENNKDKNLQPQPAIEKQNLLLEHNIKLPDIIHYYDKLTDTGILKDLFLVDMPEDFYKFYECLNKNNDVEKTLSAVNLQLIGPYELFLGKLPQLDDGDLYLINWRFFYDPPEFQAVLKKKGKSEYHIGYYRDSPEEKPVFLASNDSAKDCLITPTSDNIFGTVYLYLQEEKKSSPFTAVACQKLMDQIKKYAEEHGFSLEGYNRKKRIANMVARTFHSAGIVVPYNKKTQLGYRRLVENDANIKKMFDKLEKATSQQEKDKVLSELQPVITYANIAVDECDFGTGLEVGIDLFCSGLKDLEPSAKSSLCSAYTLLKREAFKKIIQMHLKCRRKGPNMSLLS